MTTSHHTRAAPWLGIRTKGYHGLPALAAALVFVGVGLAWWQAVYRSEVVNYGAPTQTYLRPMRATEGDKIELCFGGIDWKRLCPAQLVTQLTPASGPRLDLPTHDILPPLEAGPVGLKCRPWIVPSLGGYDDRGRPIRSEGPAVLSGFNAAQCTPLDYFYRIYTPLPRVEFDWRRK